MKAVILYSGSDNLDREDEKDTLVQMREITDHLRAFGHEATPVPFTPSLSGVEAKLKAISPDYVFNL